MSINNRSPRNQTNDQVQAFPDPTSFLYNRYLVDTRAVPEAYYKAQESDSNQMSPRTRFFLQNKNQPQFALAARESEEEIPPFSAV